MRNTVIAIKAISTAKTTVLANGACMLFWTRADALVQAMVHEEAVDRKLNRKMRGWAGESDHQGALDASVHKCKWNRETDLS